MIPSQIEISQAKCVKKLFGWTSIHAKHSYSICENVYIRMLRDLATYIFKKRVFLDGQASEVARLFVDPIISIRVPKSQLKRGRGARWRQSLAFSAEMRQFLSLSLSLSLSSGMPIRRHLPRKDYWLPRTIIQEIHSRCLSLSMVSL